MLRMLWLHKRVEVIPNAVILRVDELCDDRMHEYSELEQSLIQPS